MKIVIVTSGQPSTNPRLVKEAIALSSRGYRITVLYSFWVQWASKQDAEFIRSYPQIVFKECGGNPVNKKVSYFLSRFFHKGYRVLSARFPRSMSLAVRAEMRTYDSLFSAAMSENADLYIAHNLGGLAVAGRAAAVNMTLYGFDAEDFHRGQIEKDTAAYKRTQLIEDFFIPEAAYITAASPLIAAAYQQVYSIKPLVINNVFSKVFLNPQIKPVKTPIKLFWFSQTIGLQRGLEDVLFALKLLPASSFSLTLLGSYSEEMKLYLQKLAEREDGNPVQLEIKPPVHPDKIFEIARDYDIGLAIEPGRDQNNDIALSNKLFTYLLAGNAIVFSATSAQELFYKEHPQVGSIYPCGDVKVLAAVLQTYLNDPGKLVQQKQYALALATELYNWETECEKVTSVINRVFSNE